MPRIVLSFLPSIDLKKSVIYILSIPYYSEDMYLESTSMIAKLIAQCRARVGVVEEAAEKKLREAKFEGVMWHGG